MKFAVSILLISTLLLAGCGYSQEQVSQAYSNGYELGYKQGYTKGYKDATGQPISPTPTTQNYVGSVNSNIYHYPSCVWAKKIYLENRIWFSSPSDARAKGYRACKVCRPP